MDKNMADITEIEIFENENIDVVFEDGQNLDVEFDEFEYSLDKQGISNDLIEVKVTPTTIEAISKTYMFEQAIPSATWEIQHNLNKYPSVSIVDSAGSVVMGDVLYVDKNKVVLTFIGQFNGKAYLN